MPSRRDPVRPANPLKLANPEREARKLHEGRARLEEAKTVDETSIRTSPLGRHD